MSWGFLRILLSWDYHPCTGSGHALQLVILVTGCWHARQGKQVVRDPSLPPFLLCFLLHEQAVVAEAARAQRAAAPEPTATPDHIRYGGMTATPLVRQLFAGINGVTARGENGGNEKRAGPRAVDARGETWLGDSEASTVSTEALHN